MILSIPPLDTLSPDSLSRCSLENSILDSLFSILSRVVLSILDTLDSLFSILDPPSRAGAELEREKEAQQRAVEAEALEYQRLDAQEKERRAQADTRLQDYRAALAEQMADREQRRQAEQAEEEAELARLKSIQDEFQARLGDELERVRQSRPRGRAGRSGPGSRRDSARSAASGMSALSISGTGL